MDFPAFEASLIAPTPPQGLPATLRALWWDAQGEWERAHELVQSGTHPDAAWVHAYLHRKEGDPGNAAYWYHRAGRPECTRSLADEWSTLANAFLREM